MLSLKLSAELRLRLRRGLCEQAVAAKSGEAGEERALVEKEGDVRARGLGGRRGGHGGEWPGGRGVRVARGVGRPGLVRGLLAKNAGLWRKLGR